jgi:hypothetical protein
LTGTNIFTPESVKQAGEVMWNNMSDQVKSDYKREYFDNRIKAMMKYIEGGVTNLDPVLFAIEDALFSKKPLPRYVPAPFYYTGRIFWATHLPESVYEYFYRDIC